MLKRKITFSNVTERHKIRLCCVCSVIICLCVTYLTTLSFAQTIQYKGTELQAGRSQVQFPMVSLEVFIDIILPALLWSWG
jgi:hypothetical protein